MADIGHSRVWLELDLAVLRENYCKMRAAVSPCELIAVLKANAYGMGVGPIAAALAGAGCRRFGVAELSEALALRASNVAVQILGDVFQDEISPAIEAGICLPVTGIEQARSISATAGQLGKEAECQFLVDTGMGRLGIDVDEAFDTIRNIGQLPNLRFSGIYSHFPMAYRGGDDYTNHQIDVFLKLIERLKSAGIDFAMRHIANSDAINNFPRSYAPPFNAVRSGINLHGCFDPEGRRIFNLNSVCTLKSRLIAIRDFKAGSSIGYGCTCNLTRDTRVGIVAAGYADGLPLALSNRGHLLIRGTKAPILGRVSMDYTAVTLEDVPLAECGDEVVCLGRQGHEEVTIDQWAALKNSHAYDIICSFGSRVKRVYVNS